MHIHVCTLALVTLLAGAHRLAEPSRVVNKRSATISSGQVDKLETTIAQVHFSGTERKQQWSVCTCTGNQASFRPRPRSAAVQITRRAR